MSIRNDLLEQILSAIQGGAEPPSTVRIAMIANTDYTISTSSASPSDLLFLSTIGAAVGLELDPADGSIRNLTGRTITLTGAISMQTNVVSGSSPELQLASARSADKINWTYNADSHREFEVATDAETVLNTTSFFVDVAPNDYIKFTCYTNSGSLEFINRSEPFEGQSVSGFTILWQLRET